MRYKSRTQCQMLSLHQDSIQLPKAPSDSPRYLRYTNPRVRTQHSIPQQTHASFLATLQVTSSSARALSPKLERLSCTPSVKEAMLTPRHTTASQGAERLASVHESAIQRLSAVPSAPLTAEEVQPAPATGFFSRLQLVMPTLAAVPSQRVASPDERRSNVPEVALPI